MCGKRLVAVLCHQLPVLGKFGELSLELQVRSKLRGISVASPARPLLRAHLVPALGDLTGCGSFPSDVDCRRTSPRRSSEPPIRRCASPDTNWSRLWLDLVSSTG